MIYDQLTKGFSNSQKSFLYLPGIKNVGIKIIMNKLSKYTTEDLIIPIAEIASSKAVLSSL